MNKSKGLHLKSSKIFNEPIRITTNQSYKKQGDVGVLVDVPEGDTVEFKHLEVYDTGLPIRHLSGNLVIGTLIAVDFTADLLNSIGNLFIDTLIVEVDGSRLTKQDYNNYHVDALGQFYNKLKTNVSNVHIRNIEAIITGEYIQGMMLSEPYNNYSNFNIGTGSVELQLDYPYALNANQLSDSFINVGNNGIIIKERKKTKFETKDLIIKRHTPGQVIALGKEPNNIHFA